VNDSLNQIQETIILMKYYSFDLNGYQLKELIAKWTKIYPHNWLPLAVTEAIYQGRLKAVSVEQILNVWLKKGKIQQNFNYEFIRLIKPDLNNIDVEKYLDISDVFLNNLSSQEKSLEHELSGGDRANSNHNLNDISENSTVNNFHPAEDFSHCFQKLRSFIINK